MHKENECDVCHYRLDRDDPLSAFLVLDVITGNTVERFEVLTCLGVPEPHLLLLIFSFGWGPHSLQPPRSSVLTVCRGRDLGLWEENTCDIYEHMWVMR